MKNRITKISLTVTIIHFSAVAILCVLLIATRIGVINSEFWFILIIVLFNAYIEFSIIIPLIISFFCILGIIKEDKKAINLICLCLSIVYEVALIIYKLKYS